MFAEKYKFFCPGCGKWIVRDDKDDKPGEPIKQHCPWKAVDHDLYKISKSK